MEKKPLVTVITVTYNSAKYVRFAIESVLNQTYGNIEYIIADDFSRDDTWEIIQQYKDPRIRAYRNETNIREYPNRKKALDFATGEYIIFIDGDDVIFPHGIETYVNYASRFPDAGMLIQKGYINNIVWPVLFSSNEAIRNAYADPVNLLTSSFASNFFRREALLSVGGINTAYKTGDEIVRLKMAARFPVAFIPGWLSWPRETPGQASATIPDDIRLDEFFRQGNELSAFLSERGDSLELGALIKKCIRHQVIEKARQCLKQFRIVQAIRYLTKYGEAYSGLLRNDQVVDNNQGVLKGYTSASPLHHKESTK